MISLWQLLTLLLFGGDRYISSAESHAVGWELSCHWWLTVSISSKPTCHDDGMDSRTCTQHTGFTLLHHCQAVTQFISYHWPVPYFGGFLFLCVNYKSNKNVSSWFLWVLSHCFLDDRKGIWCVKNDYYLSPRGFLLEQVEEKIELTIQLIIQQVQYKLCAAVHRCLQHKVPQYMTDCCIHISDIARRLPSAVRTSTLVFDVWSSGLFSVAGLAAWKSLQAVV